ncbi:hypothetical protein KIL84_017250 [Mauremys mutica]|uniref:Uncharacterized protein n=1 Tax=Mauremys mutica TaxID=74926 RepID=A0A9D3X5S0_9SAUR|nr:hypothetical protein KIL84_017250 [Mauremys mutica]
MKGENKAGHIKCIVYIQEIKYVQKKRHILNYQDKCIPKLSCCTVLSPNPKVDSRQSQLQDPGLVSITHFCPCPCIFLEYIIFSLVCQVYHLNLDLQWDLVAWTLTPNQRPIDCNVDCKLFMVRTCLLCGPRHINGYCKIINKNTHTKSRGTM